MSDKGPSELLVEAWVKTVETQEHFNQIEMDIRKTAVALVGGAIGATTLTDSPGAKTMLLVAGLVAWLAFFFMDYAWYHRLLLGAVVHGEHLEDELQKLNVQIKLSKSVRDKSAVTLFGKKLHSNDKIVAFYGVGFAILVAAVIATWALPKEEKKDADKITVEIPADGLNITVHRTGKEKAAQKTQ